MRFGSKERHACLAVLSLLLVISFLFVPDVTAQQRIRLTVGDTTGSSGELNSAITVTLTNLYDEIPAFHIWIRLTEPGIAEFQTDIDTVIDTTYWHCATGTPEDCTEWVAVDFPEQTPEDVDSIHIDTVEAIVGSFDTVGTRISGWEMVDARSIISGADGMDIRVSAIADRASVEGTHPPLSPGTGVLFRLLADILPIPPEQTNRTVTVYVDPSWKENFAISDLDGHAIGWVVVEVPDINYYMCTIPDPEGCLEWTKVHEWECPTEGCDSVAYTVEYTTVLDEDQVALFPGELTVENWVCGDVTGEGNVSIGDISLIIDHLFINFPDIDPIEPGNTNCSTEVPIRLTIGDISALIDHLFINQEPLCCEN